ncbi:MAG: hypothetical protein ND807_11425 [Vicinamibacterales bacterium]|nr:hypothetical protein [Vicinamibacterales bacterium]
MRSTILVGLLGACFMPVTPALAQRQQAPAQDGQTQSAQDLPPREVQRLLDGYAVIQGQEFLGLDDSQFAQFLPKFRALQETRRRNETERLRLLQELNRMTNPRAASQSGDNDVRDRLRMLREVEGRAVGEIQKAREAVDQTLDVRQQARFRVFEEQVEQRKFQLLMQVRQNRANRPLARPQQPQ